MKEGPEMRRNDLVSVSSWNDARLVHLPHQSPIQTSVFGSHGDVTVTGVTRFKASSLFCQMWLLLIQHCPSTRALSTPCVKAGNLL